MPSFLIFLFSLKVAFCTCHAENKQSGFRSGRSHYTVKRLGRLPKAINESSGLVYRSGSNTFWTHNDSGGRPTLYEVSPNGMLLDSLPLPFLSNIDWEAISQRDSTVLFIGDIGNNQNTRRKLTIYRVRVKQPDQPEVITFQYANQRDFPPAKDTRNFDSEALVYAHDSLFIVSKNRSQPRRPVNLYGMPSQPGDYKLLPKDSVYLKSMVTDASLSPDGKTLAVLTYGKIFLFETKDGEVSFGKPNRCLRIPRGQTEGISFVNNTDFVMSNERGKLFLVKKKQRKQAPNR
ncbi:SdiA-regulated domain-containing protein [Tellurirhabdus bombi]|uniref:SdiA-regulated domain-containing protein n=1 Tax=Tellurirhabdus bombi TaxID=2907205 RepID=UPI001F387C89|nr:SdiA-regulated domain-containing protein [Tellurirhabdus bombi]